jgi:hypothetical protein
LPRQLALRIDRVAGADAAVHAEYPGKQPDQLIAGGADDERGPAFVLVGVDLVEHLGVDAGQDPGEQVGNHARDLALGDTAQQLGHLGQQGLGLLVRVTAKPVSQVLACPAHDRRPADDSGPVGRAPEMHARRPRHQGLVEIEESGGAQDGLRPFGV